MNDVSDPSLKSTVFSEANRISENIIEGDLIRMWFYLVLGFGSVILINILFSDSSSFQNVSDGVFIASIVFALHEYLHTCVLQLGNEIRQIESNVLGLFDRDSLFIDFLVVSINLLIALPMFAFSEHSIKYTNVISALVLIIGTLWGMRYFLYQLQTPEINSVDLTDIKIGAWKDPARISFNVTGQIVLLIVATIFFQTIYTLSTPHFLPLFISLLFILIFLFSADFYHYKFLSTLVFVFYFPVCLKYYNHFHKVIGYLFSFLLIILWALMIKIIQDNKTVLLGEQPPELMMVSIYVSLIIMGLIVSAPRFIRWLRRSLRK